MKFTIEEGKECLREAIVTIYQDWIYIVTNDDDPTVEDNVRRLAFYKEKINAALSSNDFKELFQMYMDLWIDDSTDIAMLNMMAAFVSVDWNEDLLS